MIFLLQVFQLYGKISNVQLKSQGSEDEGACSAIVTFESAINAALACLSLNKRWLPRDQAYLLVNILNPNSNENVPKVGKNKFSLPKNGQNLDSQNMD